MRKEILRQFREDLKEFREMTMKFYQKEISIPEYKSFSGGFGSYAQRGGERSMLRLRLAGGEVDKNKLSFIADSIQKYRIDKAHFTTCQTIQLHNLTQETVCALIEEALDHGIITRGGGGDFPRNVMCSPLSGVELGEAFDVMPYAKDAGDYLLTLISSVKLPRKLKVCFSNGRKNEPHATFRDLGFVAKENQTFDVYAAGGLGKKPKFGVLVAENISPDKILYCIKAMVDVFTQYGNYESRAASRSRFLQDTLGIEGLQKAFAEKLENNLQTEKLDLDISKIEEQQKKEEDILAKKLKYLQTEENVFSQDPRVTAQKQKGLYAVEFHPTGGIAPTRFLEKLSEIIANMDGVKIRLMPNQGLYVINLLKEEAEQILFLTREDDGTVFQRSTACIGADICQVGIGKSQAMLELCMERVRKEHFANGILPAIHISGCPSSCSAHQTAAIGMRGGKKKTENGLQDAFAVYENGCEEMGKEQMGREVGVMLVEDIPEFLVDLGHAIEKSGMTYEEFRKNYPERIDEIASNYL